MPPNQKQNEPLQPEHLAALPLPTKPHSRMSLKSVVGSLVLTAVVGVAVWVAVSFMAGALGIVKAGHEVLSSCSKTHKQELVIAQQDRLKLQGLIIAGQTPSSLTITPGTDCIDGQGISIAITYGLTGTTENLNPIITKALAANPQTPKGPIIPTTVYDQQSTDSAKPTGSQVTSLHTNVVGWDHIGFTINYVLEHPYQCANPTGCSIDSTNLDKIGLLQLPVKSVTITGDQSVN